MIKQENKDHGVLNDVSEHLNLHNTECVFYEDFAGTMPIRGARSHGILPHSRAIIMEDLRKYDRAPTFDLESGLKVVKAWQQCTRTSEARLGRLSKYRHAYGRSRQASLHHL